MAYQNLSLENRNNLNRSIKSNEIEAVIKGFQRKVQACTGSLLNPMKVIKKPNQHVLALPQITERRNATEAILRSLCHPDVKPRKKHRSISLMNMDVKILHKNIYRWNQRPLKIFIQNCFIFLKL